MKTAILLSLCLLGFTGCTRCELEEDEAKNKYDVKVKNDSLKIK